MSRPKEFDENVALDRAINCFWRYGYEASSVRQLATTMGISQPSLYNTFGDKRDLFARALRRYVDQSTRARIARLESSKSPKQAIICFFEEVVDGSAKGPLGCFLVNSAVDVASEDAKLAQVVASSFEEIESFFARSIAAAQSDGTVSSDRPAKSLARLFLGILLGMRVLARSKADRMLLRGVAEPALALLN